MVTTFLPLRRGGRMAAAYFCMRVGASSSGKKAIPMAVSGARTCTNPSIQLCTKHEAMMSNSKSPTADQATLAKVSKLLPLLNSANDHEVQAAVAALRKFDQRDV